MSAPRAKAFALGPRAWRRCARCARPLRRGARLPGAVEVGGLGAAVRRAARRRLGAAARAASRPPRCCSARPLARERPRPRHRQEPRAAARARHRGGRHARVPAAVQRRRPWRASTTRAGRARRRRSPCSTPAAAGRASCGRPSASASSRAACTALGLRSLVTLRSGRAGSRRPRRRGVGRRRARARSRRPSSTTSSCAPARAARRRRRHRPAAPRLRGGHAGGGALRADRPGAQRALRAARTRWCAAGPPCAPCYSRTCARHAGIMGEIERRARCSRPPRAGSPLAREQGSHAV